MGRPKTATEDTKTGEIAEDEQIRRFFGQFAYPSCPKHNLYATGMFSQKWPPVRLFSEADSVVVAIRGTSVAPRAPPRRLFGKRTAVTCVSF